ncbi:Uncharacterized protein TCM_033409 [Theobroma cacao]|uniref:Uncharacterized protein n=1 Tax=Theobroma cacao TaxID=3641 RepID=A0A061FI37_THECC|nr:Uncharacterized protein TCM_033409 [Theobroma cacao]
MGSIPTQFCSLASLRPILFKESPDWEMARLPTSGTQFLLSLNGAISGCNPFSKRCRFDLYLVVAARDYEFWIAPCCWGSLQVFLLFDSPICYSASSPLYPIPGLWRGHAPTTLPDVNFSRLTSVIVCIVESSSPNNFAMPKSPKCATISSSSRILLGFRSQLTIDPISALLPKSKFIKLLRFLICFGMLPFMLPPKASKSYKEIERFPIDTEAYH